MAGLSLNVGGYGAAGGGGASIPAAAGTPGGPTIGQRAFGISSGQGTGPRTAGYGTMILAAAGAGLLAWLWWTLPR